jgi:hypothetical protein
MPDAIDELDALLRELRDLDPHRRVFGSRPHGGWGHDYRFNPCLSETDITTFETQYSLVLPEEYRQFLLRLGNGGAGPNYGIKPLREATAYCDLSIPFPWTAEKRFELHLDPEAELWNSWPGILNFSECGCGYFDFLIVRGEQIGQIWTDCGELLVPKSTGFVQWYRSWAERCIKTIQREPLLKQIRIGMTVDEVRHILGTDMQRWTGNEWRKDPKHVSDQYYIGFTNTNASSTIGPDDRVRKINSVDFVP